MFQFSVNINSIPIPPYSMGNSQPKNNIYVQTVSAKVMSIYESIQTASNTNTTVDSRLSVLKSTNVKRIALTSALQDFQSGCKCKQLRSDVQSMVHSIEGMNLGGQCRLFICHSQHNVKSRLEFVCAAVRVYRNREGHEAADFCLATYSYAKAVSKGKLMAGVGSVTGGSMVLAFGVFALTTGLLVPAIALATLSLGTTIVGSGATVAKAAFATKISTELRDQLEASFLYEMVVRGHALITDDHKLYMIRK